MYIHSVIIKFLMRVITFWSVASVIKYRLRVYMLLHVLCGLYDTLQISVYMYVCVYYWSLGS